MTELGVCPFSKAESRVFGSEKIMAHQRHVEAVVDDRLVGSLQQ